MRALTTFALPLAPVLFVLLLVPRAALAQASGCPAEPASNVPIVSGDVYVGPSCVLSSPGDIDSFVFNANNGDTYQLAVAINGGVQFGPDFCLTLYDPNAKQIFSGCSDTPNLVFSVVTDQTLTTTGAYTMDITEPGSGTVEYAVSLERLYPFPPNAQQVALAKVVAGDIAPLTDSNAFTFAGVTTGTYRVTANLPSVQFENDLCMTVYSPGGTSAGSACTDSANLSFIIQIDFTPPQSGTYMAFLSEAGNTGTATYSLEVSCLVGNCGSAAAPPPSQLSVSPAALQFSFLEGNTTPSSLALTLANGTPQSVMFSATTSGQPWLSVSPASAAAAFSNATVTVTVNPASLSPGTYTATINLATPGQEFVVPVIVTVNSAQLAIAISQTALRFQAATGAGEPPSQSITVLNQGTGALNWSAIPSALVGSWLSVTPSNGAAGDAARVSVDPANLAPGVYYGLVTFTAAGAPNSPQAAVVVLNVMPAASAVPTVEPTGLIFVGQQGGTNPAAQTVAVSNPSNQSITVTPTPVAQQNGVFSITPSGSVTVTSAQAAQFMVSANLAGLVAGVYPGVIQFAFGDGSVQQVAVALIVTPPGSDPSARVGLRAAVASGCTPTQLIPVSTGLGQSFTEVAAWPTPLIIQVVDDCGNPMGPGTVAASFSNGDPQLSLVSLGGGMWSATWEPRYTAAAASMVITVQAQSLQPVLTGTLQISGTLDPNQSTPAISNGGVVSAASFAAHAPLAPGGFISIFGANFTAGSNSASSLPLTATLGGVHVVIAGEQLPLLFAGSGQINAIIPYDVAPNSTQQLIVQQNMTLSLPEAVTIAPAQPALFTQDQSGAGIGVIVVLQPDGAGFEADSSHPASAGDVLVIYCTGLGAVNPTVLAGSAGPASPPSNTSNTVTATIGGQPAKVLFAGLAPGFAGLYQVNVLVPSGITAAPSVPVILMAGGLASPPVTIPIH
jgi:uncharacterized protein (TIGR03437 family)